MGNISIWQLLILLLVIVLIFGTKKLRSIGSDLGGAVKDFKKAMNTEEESKVAPQKITDQATTQETSTMRASVDADSKTTQEKA